ncbi:MAG: hypothetical protein JO112_01170, partial [Planctomycetes bacterium]|nr:hypothetical protein [Planctomycetota bacterium]
YRANQSPTLTADLIGPHGETLPRFLRPGLHSGTLPKLFPKLRRAEQAHPRLEPWRSPPKYHEALHHVEESLRHFVERQFLFLLNQSRRWGPARVTAGEIDLAPSRIRMEVCCPELGSPGLMVSFEEQAGRLLAGAAAPDWLPKLTADQYQALTDALAGFYKLAGVDLVRPQIEACLGPKVFSYTVTAEGLLVWSGLHSGPDAVYPWAEGEVLRPRPLDGTGLDSYPPVPAAELLFPKVPVSWKDWVEVWEKDQEGQGVSRLALARGWVLLESRPMLVSAAATPVGP